MIDYYNLFIFGIEVKYEFLSYEQPVPINLACVKFHRFNCSPWSIVCRDNSIYVPYKLGLWQFWRLFHASLLDNCFNNCNCVYTVLLG